MILKIAFLSYLEPQVIIILCMIRADAFRLSFPAGSTDTREQQRSEDVLKSRASTITPNQATLFSNWVFRIHIDVGVHNGVN